MYMFAWYWNWYWNIFIIFCIDHHELSAKRHFSINSLHAIQSSKAQKIVFDHQEVVIIFQQNEHRKQILTESNIKIPPLPPPVDTAAPAYGKCQYSYLKRLKDFCHILPHSIRFQNLFFPQSNPCNSWANIYSSPLDYLTIESLSRQVEVLFITAHN